MKLSLFHKELSHDEVLVAGQRASGRGHDDRTSGRAGWDRGSNLRTRQHGERRRNTVKCNACCAPEVVPENPDRCAHVAGGGQCFHERA